MISFWVNLHPEEDNGAEMDVEKVAEQPDGSVLVWYGFYAEEPPSGILRASLRVDITQGEKSYPPEAPFSLTKSESPRSARHVPESDGWIGDHVKVREGYVSFTKVRACLTVDYGYEEQPDEPMGVWLHPCDGEGNTITTDSGSTSESDASEALAFYRQRDEMQSFDEIPDVGCVSKCREMQFRADWAAFQGGFPQVCWRQIKGNQRRNAVQDAENALQAF